MSCPKCDAVVLRATTPTGRTVHLDTAVAYVAAWERWPAGLYVITPRGSALRARPANQVTDAVARPREAGPFHAVHRCD